MTVLLTAVALFMHLFVKVGLLGPGPRISRALVSDLAPVPTPSRGAMSVVLHGAIRYLMLLPPVIGLQAAARPERRVTYPVEGYKTSVLLTQNIPDYPPGYCIRASFASPGGFCNRLWFYDDGNMRVEFGRLSEVPHIDATGPIANVTALLGDIIPFAPPTERLPANPTDADCEAVARKIAQPNANCSALAREFGEPDGLEWFRIFMIVRENRTKELARTYGTTPRF
ncbi:hypothetical protein FOZ60_008040 [Perkinsus olseni]|uniref:Uncharacterized protein n=1 Tax=Perkinsus olseni TaxID=32597 RepID=A0A7J6PEP9_PEROL|nr:hypothetical protein FOZ60_008040 [Perkinsus olseni]